MAGQLGTNPYASELGEVPSNTINLTTGGGTGTLTGVLPVANGGTGFTSLLIFQSFGLSPYQTQEQRALADANARLFPGANQTTSWFDDMAIGPPGVLTSVEHKGWTITTGMTQDTTVQGGVITANTSAVAGTLLTAQAPGFFVPRPDVNPWWFGVRGKINTAIDAQSFLIWGICPGTNNFNIFFGIDGFKNTANFVGVYDATGFPNGGTGNQVPLAPVDLLWHTFEAWGLGNGIVHFAMDGLEFGTGSTMLASATVPVSAQFATFNGTTAANRGKSTDWMGLACNHI